MTEENCLIENVHHLQPMLLWRTMCLCRHWLVNYSWGQLQCCSTILYIAVQLIFLNREERMESISKLKLINDKWPLRPVPPSHRHTSHPALVIKLKTSTTVNHLVNTINANIYNISIFNIQHPSSYNHTCHVQILWLWLLAMVQNLPKNGVLAREVSPWSQSGAWQHFAAFTSLWCGQFGHNIRVCLSIFPKYFTLKLKSAIIGRDILGTINTLKRHRDQFGNVCSLKDVFLRQLNTDISRDYRCWIEAGVLVIILTRLESISVPCGPGSLLWTLTEAAVDVPDCELDSTINCNIQTTHTFPKANTRWMTDRPRRAGPQIETWGEI